jgi:GxxExxY protein
MDAPSKIIYKDESYAIIGACMKVHRALGPGFLEAVYEEVVEKEFIVQNIPYKRQVKLDLYYEGVQLKKHYRADFVCYDSIIVELKAVSQITFGILCATTELFKMHEYGVRNVD